ncbi:MAG: bifunctional glycosyltransferase family 2/GtrA family protein [Bacilli bacterium]|nr:bifunctional glycosyltransferase family 2/GtrA family protein [Bacilli bacterium]
MKNKSNKYLILIPAYNPSTKLIELVDDLSKCKLDILIVNDGSINSDKIFNELREKNNCIVLEYSENSGKGYAMKYGIDYYLNDLQDKYLGIVTVDADYQHKPSDVLKVIDNMGKDKIVLGSRNFKSKNVPLPNRMGNQITSTIFKFLYGTKIFDTQTGLRGIPNEYLENCLEIKGDRYEYEMEELIYFVNKKIEIKEVEIETVYYEEDESKFNKVQDSFKIYKVMLKESFRFLITSLMSALVDLILFTIFLNVFYSMGYLSIILATFIARIISEFLNFNLTKSFVFNSKEKAKDIIFKYYLLSFLKMILSALMVVLISKVIVRSETLIKIVVDTLLYFMSYRIQKKFIFKTCNE